MIVWSVGLIFLNFSLSLENHSSIEAIKTTKCCSAGIFDLKTIYLIRFNALKIGEIELPMWSN
jgi:hypothetical protein